MTSNIFRYVKAMKTSPVLQPRKSDAVPDDERNIPSFRLTWAALNAIITNMQDAYKVLPVHEETTERIWQLLVTIEQARREEAEAEDVQANITRVDEVDCKDIDVPKIHATTCDAENELCNTLETDREVRSLEQGGHGLSGRANADIVDEYHPRAQDVLEVNNRTMECGTESEELHEEKENMWNAEKWELVP
ncbi:MAG: hypothetical protein Q9159_000861 [Coniocarpon cinnabarinum]